MAPTEILGQDSQVYETEPSYWNITIQRRILIHLDPVTVLVLVSKTVFISMYTPLVAIRFGASAQLVSSNLLSCHSGGAMEEAAGGKRGCSERVRTR